MLKKIVLALVALVLVLGVVVALQPTDYHVERSKVVAAGPDVTYAVLSDFDRFEEWSPWQERDPAMKKTIDGGPGEVGTKYSWSGNDDVGKGSMTFTKLEPGKRLDMDLHFITPFEAKSTTSWILAADGAGTKVTWTMDGKNDFMGKAFGLMMDMDAMIGADYDKGLAKLDGVVKAEAEKIAAAQKKAEEEAAAAAAAAAAEGEGEGGADEGDGTDAD